MPCKPQARPTYRLLEHPVVFLLERPMDAQFSCALFAVYTIHNFFLLGD